MRTTREIGHELSGCEGYRSLAHPGAPGYHTHSCDDATAAIENARADGVVALFREEDQGITGAPPRPMVERTLARLGITLDKFGERMGA